ncbi:MULTISPECIES: hypothetical protein [Pseudomonas]|uniref:hypothetical protein n=1 Tax=Pseudomonas TaxID=286 RepID=UPI001F002138|nr:MULTISPECIES: hypothetical protein [Pseudomonas]MCG8295194.1 hypothetical protein [Pseudomonas entomophila]
MKNDADINSGELVRLSRPEFLWRKEGELLKRLVDEAFPVAELLVVDRSRVLSGNYKWIKPENPGEWGYWRFDETGTSPANLELVWVSSIPANKGLGGGWVNSNAL